MAPYLEFMYKLAGVQRLIRTHFHPHLDELTALFLAERFANKSFLSAYMCNGALELGVGGGPFDEHGRGTQKRKEGKCCATLMENALRQHGCIDEQQGNTIKSLLKWVTAADLKSSTHEHLAYYVKAMHLTHHAAPLVVYDWVKTALLAFVTSDLRDWRPPTFGHLSGMMGKRSHLEAKADGWVIMGSRAVRYEKELMEEAEADWKKAALHSIKVPGGEVVVCLAETNNPRFQMFVSSPMCQHVDILVQRCPLKPDPRWQLAPGNTQIFLLNRRKIATLKGVVAALNLCEQVVTGGIKVADWEQLTQEGRLTCWHYFPPGEMILNGSLTYPVPATQLSSQNILQTFEFLDVAKAQELAAIARKRMRV